MSRIDDQLIPIRLELNVGGAPVTEYFTWSGSEEEVTPLQFASILAADLNLPGQSVQGIAASIAEQIADYKDTRNDSEGNVPSASQGIATSVPMRETRQVIKLNVRVGRVVLKDQFEWDASHGGNSPEAFAEILSEDLGLGREFVPAIAHAVREQLLEPISFRRRRVVCPQLNGRTAVRAPSSTEIFEPLVECLSLSQQDNLERREKREARLAARNRVPRLLEKGSRATNAFRR